MANFQSEGQGTMTGTIIAVWRIEPATAPRPIRHCSICGESRPFHSSGKIRLNANGRRLDAWLIYKCTSCDKTWNRPLVERAAVNTIPATDLTAMHTSDPEWVCTQALDIASLGRHFDRIEISSDLTVTKITNGDRSDAWSAIELTIDARRATGMRLDRLLARELALARSELRAMQGTGGLQFCSDSDRMLRKPVVGRFTLRFVAFRLTERQVGALSSTLWTSTLRSRP
jgi:hypothetical protein